MLDEQGPKRFELCGQPHIESTRLPFSFPCSCVGTRVMTLLRLGMRWSASITLAPTREHGSQEKKTFFYHEGHEEHEEHEVISSCSSCPS
jgi:hypothetical protein